MKKTLPKLTIKNAYSAKAKIVQKVSKLKFFLNSLIASLVIAIAATGYITGSAAYASYNEMHSRLTEETQKALDGQPSIVLDATADIIVRESKNTTPPEVAKKYATWIFESASKNSVDPLMILSVMKVESQFDYRAMSPTGAIGLMQIIHSWHKEKTTKAGLFDPKNNIDVGAQILKEYSAQSRTQAEVLLRYNGSLGKAPVYATKVLLNQSRYEKEIFNQIANKEI